VAKNDNSLTEVDKYDAGLTTRLAALPGSTSVSKGGWGRVWGAPSDEPFDERHLPAVQNNKSAGLTR